MGSEKNAKLSRTKGINLGNQPAKKGSRGMGLCPNPQKKASPKKGREAQRLKKTEGDE